MKEREKKRKEKWLVIFNLPLRLESERNFRGRSLRRTVGINTRNLPKIVSLQRDLVRVRQYSCLLSCIRRCSEAPFNILHDDVNTI